MEKETEICRSERAHPSTGPEERNPDKEEEEDEVKERQSDDTLTESQHINNWVREANRIAEEGRKTRTGGRGEGVGGGEGKRKNKRKQRTG